MKGRLKNFALVLGSIIIGLAIVEGVLRYLGWFSYTWYKLSSFGYHLAENQNFSWVKPCFCLHGLKTNNFGLRQPNDVSLEKKGKFRIALMGDSYVEALQVNDNENISSLLQNLLGQNVEILNFGVSGYGTVQELAQYYKWVRRFRPDICVVFACINDIRNNHPELERDPLRPYLIFENGQWRLQYVSNNALKMYYSLPATLHRWLRSHSRLYNAVYQVFLQNWVLKKFSRAYGTELPSIKKNISPATNTRIHEKALGDLGVFFCPPPDRRWQEAWEITRVALRMFAEAIERDEAKIALVLLPGTLHMAKNPYKSLKNSMGYPPPKAFKLNCPILKLEKYAAASKIPCLSLLKPMKDYRTKFHVPYPFFSYRCDGHYNPLGHCLVAASVVRFLLEDDFIPPSVVSPERRAQLLKLTTKIFSLNPKKILGETAWCQIYERGIYRGQSNVAKVLTLP